MKSYAFQALSIISNKWLKIIDKHVTNYVYNGIDGFITDRKDVALFTFYAGKILLAVAKATFFKTAMLSLFT